MKKLVESRFVNDQLMLFRISLREEKIILANEDTKLAFINLLAFYLKDMDFSDNSSLYLFLNSYASHLNLKDFNFLNYKPEISEKDFKNYIKKISKIVKVKEKTGNFIIDIIPFIGIKKYRFRLFFLFNLLFIRYLCLMTNIKNSNKNNLMMEDIERLSEYINLNASERNLFKNLLNIFDKSYYKDIGKNIEDLILESNNKYLISSSVNLLKNIKIVTNYNSLPIYNVGIFATMSAGKSTFVNALLDRDIIPSKNEACTAKITSISDNDSVGVKIFGGCSLDNNKFMFSNNINERYLQEWNNNDNVEHIFLETDIKNVHSKNGILVIHDTPGPNNSIKVSHGEITKNFINKNKIDLYIYLINAEHNTTEDNLYFMEDLYASFKKKKGAKILFLLNKIDSFDLEVDDIEVSINNAKTEIEKAGFKSPLIIPISSNAARLFKKALHNQELSKKELIDFSYLFSLFSKESRMNLPSYCSEEVLKMSDVNYSYNDNFISEKNIIVGNAYYNREDLIKALDKTSINLVRNILNKEING